MSGRIAQLAIELAEHGASDVISSLGGVEGAAKSMGDTVDRASRQADDSAGRLDRVTESADNLGSKSGELTGALGALSSGFELVGLGPYATGLQSAAMATDFLSGVGDTARLVLESQAVASARAKVAMVAQAVASRTTAVAQRALNLAMAANPVLLVVAGVAALVAILILAYKRSETFRNVVNGAMGVAKAGVDKLRGAFHDAVDVLDVVKDAAKDTVGWIGDHAASIADKFSDAWSRVKRVGTDALDELLAPVRTIIDLVDSLLDKIKSIHVPHVDVNPFNRGGTGTDSPGSSGGDVVTIYVTVEAAPGTTSAQAQQTAQDTMDAIDSRLRTTGRKPVFARS